MDARDKEISPYNTAVSHQRDVNSKTYISSKPLTWRIRICLTIVLLPDSPAP